MKTFLVDKISVIVDSNLDVTIRVGTRNPQETGEPYSYVGIDVTPYLRGLHTQLGEAIAYIESVPN